MAKRKTVTSLVPHGMRDIVSSWIPGHVEIPGNVVDDHPAKVCSGLPLVKSLSSGPLFLETTLPLF